MLEKPYFLKLREVFKGWQKVMMKQSQSCRTSFLLKVYQKWNQKHRCHTLNGLIRDSSRKPFQMYSPPRCYQPHKASSLSFKSRPENLNAIISDQGYKFGPFVTNRQKCFLRLHWSLTDNGCRPSGNVWHCEQLNLVHMKLSLSKMYWSVCVFCILLSIQWFFCDLLC